MNAPIPAIVLVQPFWSLTRTAEELSIVLPEEVDLPGAVVEGGWRALQVAGVLDFSLTGILAGISGVLAQANISMFALSTYNTDYILVRAEKLEAAVAALQQAGYQV